MQPEGKSLAVILKKGPRIQGAKGSSKQIKDILIPLCVSPYKGENKKPLLISKGLWQVLFLSLGPLAPASIY